MTQHTRVSAIIIKANQVLLQRRDKDKKEYLIFPGGTLQSDESPSQAIHRIIKELTMLNISQIFEVRDYLDPSDNVRYHYVVCEIEDGLPTNIGSDNFEWVNIADAIYVNNLYPSGLKDHLKYLHEKSHENKQAAY